MDGEMIILSNILYTYNHPNELRYLNDENYLKISRLESEFNYSHYDYVDITNAIEHLYYNPQNKILLQCLEEDLGEYCVAIINENFADIALDMYPTIFYTKEKLSDRIPELNDLVIPNNLIEKRELYYYHSEEKTILFDYFDENNIQFIDIGGLRIQERIKNMNFNLDVLVDITPLINDKSTELLEFFIRKLAFINIIFICEYESYKNEFKMYFENKEHISERYTDFVNVVENDYWDVKKVIDFNNIEFDNLINSIDNNLIGHNHFKTELYKQLKQFKVLNELNLKKIFSIFLLGDSGLGKTEVARILNKSLNDKFQLIKINFGNYSSKDSINSLIGSPRGYIGSEDGELSLKLCKKHSGIILCDEFEKADSKIISFFLELLEEGKFTDSQSIEYDLNGYVIIFTSNLNRNGFSKDIPHEFQSRLDLIFEFDYLTHSEKEKFVLLELEKIKKTMMKNPKYKDIDLSDFNLNFNLDEINNLRDIQRKLYDQLIEIIIKDINE